MEKARIQSDLDCCCVECVSRSAWAVLCLPTDVPAHLELCCRDHSVLLRLVRGGFGALDGGDYDYEEGADDQLTVSPASLITMIHGIMRRGVIGTM